MKSNHDWRRATLQAHRDLSPTVREFEIRPDGGVRPWSVGSHLKLRVDTGTGDDTRFYSLVGLPQESLASGLYRIAVKRVPASRGGSRHMWGLQAGDELRVGDPDSHFEPGLKAAGHLILAGGIGITPLLGMAQVLAERGAALQMRYAARSADELVYRDRLQALLGERLQTFCSDAGQRMDIAAEIAALHPQGQLLVCGPMALLDAARDAWQQAGRDPALMRFETFGSSGHAVAQPFWVELPRHGLRVEVPADRSLLDVLDDAGVETVSDCRRGECGLCAMDIVSVQGNIDHRDVFFSSQEKQANQRLCACVSRISGGGVVLDSAYRPD
jgi:vanillate O-demethylase ferredoxin subunit